MKHVILLPGGKHSPEELHELLVHRSEATRKANVLNYIMYVLNFLLCEFVKMPSLTLFANNRKKERHEADVPGDGSSAVQESAVLHERLPPHRYRERKRMGSLLFDFRSRSRDDLRQEANHEPRLGRNS
jgi:hypothetical protein